MKTQIHFEMFRDVARCVEMSGGDAQLGFEDARRDDLAVEQIKDDLRLAGLTAEQIAAIEISAVFQEFDSGNWTHAQAVFEVFLEVPAETVAKVRDCYAAELDSSEDNDD